MFFGARDEPASAGRGERLLPRWRCAVFDSMGRNALHPTERFDLPSEQFPMIGRRLTI